MSVCDPCSTEGRSREAISFCEICKEYFCSSCSLQHKRFKVSKNHKQRNVSDKSPAPLTENQQHSSPADFSKLSISDHSVPSDDSLHYESATIETVPSDNADAMVTAPTDTERWDILNLKIKSVRKVNIRLPEDRENPRISGCDFLPNGDLLLLDHENDRLKLLERTGEVRNIADMSLYSKKSRSWNLTVVNENKVAITFPSFDKKVQFCQLKPSFTKVSSIVFRRRCFGVATAVGRIHVTCHNNEGKDNYHPGEVHTLDMNGKEIWNLGGRRHGGRVLFSTPEYITVNKDGSAIYVSDTLSRTIFTLSAGGKMLSEIKLDGQKGIAGIQIDSQLNIFICGFDSNNVQVVRI